jgi:hypothetical protein
MVYTVQNVPKCIFNPLFIFNLIIRFPFCFIIFKSTVEASSQKYPYWPWGQPTLLFRWNRRLFLRVRSGRGGKLSTHSHLVVRLRMNELAFTLIYIMHCFCYLSVSSQLAGHSLISMSATAALAVIAFSLD